MPVTIQLANPCRHSVLQQNYPGIFLLSLLSNHVAKPNSLYRDYHCPCQEEGSTLLTIPYVYIPKLSSHVHDGDYG